MWTEEHQIKIKFLRPHPKANDLSVAFGVNGDNQKKFEKALISFLKHCEKSGAKIVTDTVADAETGKPCKLLIDIAGNQQELTQKFAQDSRQFIESSTWYH